MTMNIRVVRFLIPADMLDCFYSRGRALTKLSVDWGYQEEDLRSGPVLSISNNFAVISDILTQGGVTYRVIDESDSFDLYITNAPQSYDYDGFLTFHVADLGEDSSGKQERLVAIPKSKADTFQTPRYRSGFCSVRKVM